MRSVFCVLCLLSDCATQRQTVPIFFWILDPGRAVDWKKDIFYSVGPVARAATADATTAVVVPVAAATYRILFTAGGILSRSCVHGRDCSVSPSVGFLAEAFLAIVSYLVFVLLQYRWCRILK